MSYKSYIALLAVGLALIFLGWRIMAGRNGEIPLPQTAPPILSATSAPARGQKAAQLYADNVEPLIAAMTRKNDEAAVRAVKTIQNRFREFRNGIDPFTKDLTSYRTQFGVIGRMIGVQYDKWWKKKKDADRVGEYVNGKFRRYVVSEEALNRAVSDAVDQYRIDLAANRNEMESQAKVVLTSLGADIDFSSAAADWPAFFQGMEHRSTAMVLGMGKETLLARCLVETGGFAAFSAATKLTSMVIERVLPHAAAQLSLRFGTAAITGVGSSTAAGAEAGSLGGPVGTLIGFGVGIAAGIVVDSWMTEKFRGDMKEQVSGYLASLEKEIIDGSEEHCGAGILPALRDRQDACATTGKEPRGVKAILTEINRMNDEATRKAMLDTMIARASV